ncbi:MAG: hypothetical protein AMJ78_04425 [Omnitrophica WOR_2 bacterium SM23_29]|nr:MAG: hypothetical protein AMJ78_04425 [Omnitrophica WOR_2 bacterium SM23_29]
MQNGKKFNLNLIKLALMALLLRFLIMPFSFHGNDIFYLNYFPFKFIEYKTFEPYLITDQSGIYYPPGIFYILVFFQFLFRAFLPKLNELFSVFAAWNFTSEANTINFADILTDHQLFRTLFLFKIPYLISDFVIGFVLFQLLKKDKRKIFIALLMWALNPFALHSVYALGQFDIIVAMFIMLSLLAIKLERPYLAIACLSLGGSVKIIPLLLIPPLVFILGKTLKEKIQLILVALAIFITPFLPIFFTTSKLTVMNVLNFGSKIEISAFRKNIFFVAYLFFLTIPFLLKKEDIDKMKMTIFSFVCILLLFFSLYRVNLRYFVWIAPLLILLVVQNRVFWIYIVVFLITLFELRAAGNAQQWGLFATLHPEFFSSLPIADSYFNLAVNVKYIHQAMYRLFVISSLTMVAHILVVNRHLLKFSLPSYGKK